MFFLQFGNTRIVRTTSFSQYQRAIRKWLLWQFNEILIPIRTLRYVQHLESPLCILFSIWSSWMLVWILWQYQNILVWGYLKFFSQKFYLKFYFFSALWKNLHAVEHFSYPFIMKHYSRLWTHVLTVPYVASHLSYPLDHSTV